MFIFKIDIHNTFLFERHTRKQAALGREQDNISWASQTCTPSSRIRRINNPDYKLYTRRGIQESGGLYSFPFGDVVFLGHEEDGGSTVHVSSFRYPSTENLLKINFDKSRCFKIGI